MNHKISEWAVLKTAVTKLQNHNSLISCTQGAMIPKISPSVSEGLCVKTTSSKLKFIIKPKEQLNVTSFHGRIIITLHKDNFVHPSIMTYCLFSSGGSGVVLHG